MPVVQSQMGSLDVARPVSGPRTSTHQARFTRAILSAMLALVAMGIGSALGDIHGPALHQKFYAVFGATGFFVFAALAVHSASVTLGSVVTARAGRSGGGAVKVISGLVGYTVMVFVGLGLLAVPVQHLLVGGALTGVIVGIAAQQALGNVFAGLVLLLARPFTLDERVRVRSGTLGGTFEGVIRGISLTYVTIETDDGMVNVPNSVMLAIGVGPAPERTSSDGLAVVRTGPPPAPLPEPASRPRRPAGHLTRRVLERRYGRRSP